MESLISNNQFNTILIIVGIILAAVLLYAFVKRLISLIAITVVIIAFYIAYMVYSGQQIPTTKQDAIKHGIEQYKKIKQEGGKALDTINQQK